MSNSPAANTTSPIGPPAVVVAFCDKELVEFYIAVGLVAAVADGIVEHWCWDGARQTGSSWLPSTWQTVSAVFGVFVLVFDAYMAAKVVACDSEHWRMLLIALGVWVVKKIFTNYRNVRDIRAARAEERANKDD